MTLLRNGYKSSIGFFAAVKVLSDANFFETDFNCYTHIAFRYLCSVSPAKFRLYGRIRRLRAWRKRHTHKQTEFLVKNQIMNGHSSSLNPILIDRFSLLESIRTLSRVVASMHKVKR